MCVLLPLEEKNTFVFEFSPLYFCHGVNEIVPKLVHSVDHLICENKA